MNRLKVGKKFRLMLLYTKGYLILSSSVSIAAFYNMAASDVPENWLETLMALSILKIIVAAMTLVLFNEVTPKNEKFFYINLGLHPRILKRYSVILDFGTFYLISILIILVKNGIQ